MTSFSTIRLKMEEELCRYVNDVRLRNAFPFTNVTKAGANLYFKDKFAAFQLIDNWSLVLNKGEKIIFMARIFNWVTFEFLIISKYFHLYVIKSVVIDSSNLVVMDNYSWSRICIKRDKAEVACFF